MEKVEDFMSKVPGIIIKRIREQQNFEQYQNYLQKVQNDIEYFKKHKTFPKPLDGVLTENVHKNVAEIKLERTSEIPHDEDDVKSCDISTSDFRKENVSPVELEMPPPQLPVRKARKIKKEPSIANTRSTRGRTSQQTQMESDNISRDSDIVVQEQPIIIITLTDSDNEDVTNIGEMSKQSNSNLEHDKSHIENVPPTTRSTRTETRIEKNDVDNEKRTISSSPSPINIQSMRQMKRKRSEEQIDNLNKTVTIQGKAVENATFAVQKEPPGSIDNTVIIGGLNIVDNGLVTNLNDIMRDDEDDNITVSVPTRDTYNIKAGTRAVFNPFEESPVKKRVEAFEKLAIEDVSGIPLAKTNAKEKEEASILTPKYLNLPREVGTTPKVANRYLATVSNSANKALKTNTMNENVRPVKAISSLKSSQYEFNERETKRREKESEAMQKRIAQMHAQTEEKKKKRLEKQIKAQQLREMQERNKLEALREAEKAKEERHKQILAEKQEKAKKLHEESERRRVEALKRAMEEKRREEERKRTVEEAQAKLKRDELRMALREERKATRVLEQKEKPRNRLPIFLREKAPLLPTEDWYDSDQERAAWTFSQKMFPQLKKMNRIGKKIVSSFFMMTVTTPNLKDIFVNIDPLKLKRTSSAVWRAPPRYTLMPEIIIEEKDEEDC